MKLSPLQDIFPQTENSDHHSPSSGPGFAFLTSKHFSTSYLSSQVFFIIIITTIQVQFFTGNIFPNGICANYLFIWQLLVELNKLGDPTDAFC